MGQTAFRSMQSCQLLCCGLQSGCRVWCQGKATVGLCAAPPLLTRKPVLQQQSLETAEILLRVLKTSADEINTCLHWTTGKCIKRLDYWMCRNVEETLNRLVLVHKTKHCLTMNGPSLNNGCKRRWRNVSCTTKHSSKRYHRSRQGMKLLELTKMQLAV